MTRLRPRVRHLAPTLVFLAAACSGGGTTEPSGFAATFALQQPTMNGSWEGVWPSQVLTCRFPVQLTATGAGSGVLIGATYTLVAPYGSYERTWTQADLARFFGNDHIAPGQTLTGTISIAAYAEFSGKITISYATSPDSPVGTTTASYTCKVP
jgi:hypothetical protein